MDHAKLLAYSQTYCVIQGHANYPLTLSKSAFNFSFKVLRKLKVLKINNQTTASVLR